VTKSYLLIGCAALLVATSELLLKKGAMSGALSSGWTWIGIVTYLLSFVCWLAVLRRLPLSIAYPLINIVQALVPLGAWWILGETMSAQRWIGIACVLCGAIVVARIEGKS